MREHTHKHGKFFRDRDRMRAVRIEWLCKNYECCTVCLLCMCVCLLFMNIHVQQMNEHYNKKISENEMKREDN